MPYMKVEMDSIPTATGHELKACHLTLKEVSELKRNVSKLLKVLEIT